MGTLCLGVLGARNAGENHSRVGLLGSTSAEVIFTIYGLNMVGADVSIIPAYSALFTKKITESIRSEKLTDFIITDDFAQGNLIKFDLFNTAAPSERTAGGSFLDPFGFFGSLFSEENGGRKLFRMPEIPENVMKALLKYGNRLAGIPAGRKNMDHDCEE